MEIDDSETETSPPAKRVHRSWAEVVTDDSQEQPSRCADRQDVHSIKTKQARKTRVQKTKSMKKSVPQNTSTPFHPQPKDSCYVPPCPTITRPENATATPRDDILTDTDDTSLSQPSIIVQDDSHHLDIPIESSTLDLSSPMPESPDHSQMPSTESGPDTVTLKGAVPNNGHFLSCGDIFNKIMNVNSEDIQEFIPNGVKENVHFFCNNSANIILRGLDKKSKFPDDCGVWISGSSKTHTYLCRDNRLTFVEQRNNVYCKPQRRVLVPLEPQPSDREIVVIKRYYVKLKRSPGYQKRVAWIQKYPDDVTPAHHIAFVEYCGSFPGTTTVNGNSKKSTGEFIRTATTVTSRIKERLKCKTPKEVYE